jgi:hypothetical protein
MPVQSRFFNGQIHWFSVALKTPKAANVKAPSRVVTTQSIFNAEAQRRRAAKKKDREGLAGIHHLAVVQMLAQILFHLCASAPLR